MRILPIVIALSMTTPSLYARPRDPSHILLKNDFNNDGQADRIVFASYGISGFFLSTQANGKVDAFELRQGNRTIQFFGRAKIGGPYIKLTENAGFFSTVMLLKYQNKVFKITDSFALPNKKFFSDDPFACESNDPFSNNAKRDIPNFSEAIKKYSIEDVIKKSIGEECKTTFGEDYPKFESQILSACKVSDGKKEKNELITCLDGNDKTRFFSSKYKMALAENIFEDGFKISCAKSDKNIPLASFDTSSKNISIFQTTPTDPNRNFKADFYHEMIHGLGINSEKEAIELVKYCLQNENEVSLREDRRPPPITDLGFKAEQEKLKDGVKISFPTKEIEASSVTSTLAESSKALDTNFSMSNTQQYNSISRLSSAAFKSFEPIMNAAYSAAIPKVFAGSSAVSLTSSDSRTSSSAIKVISDSNKETTVTSQSANTSQAVYEIPTLPSSEDTSLNVGNLTNGLNIKVEDVKKQREIASVNGATGGGSGSGYVDFTSSINKSSKALSANVPRISEEEAFIKTLTTGKYADVKKKLLDPNIGKIMEKKRIQYLDKTKVIGSKQPMIILKDLGNSFSIQRVLVE